MYSLRFDGSFCRNFAKTGKWSPVSDGISVYPDENFTHLQRTVSDAEIAVLTATIGIPDIFFIHGPYADT